MSSRIVQTVNQADSQYLNPNQQKDVLDYARSLPARFTAARAVQEAEGEIASRVLKEWEQSHPELGPAADLGWPEAAADLRVVVRAAALGVLMDDPDYAEARAAGTLRRTLEFLDVPTGASNDLFALLAATAREALPAAAADLLVPHLTRLTAVSRPAPV
ncbi:hypothetical protein [Gemmata sp.]|uniref:hypothetical protein n=1 Tax=Gemmata sp. TaxID=1914242 RepID=UPI003F706524